MMYDSGPSAGADPGFFLEGGAHIVFLQDTSYSRKPPGHLGGGGGGGGRVRMLCSRRSQDTK